MTPLYDPDTLTVYNLTFPSLNSIRQVTVECASDTQCKAQPAGALTDPNKASEDPTLGPHDPTGLFSDAVGGAASCCRVSGQLLFSRPCFHSLPRTVSSWYAVWSSIAL